MPQIQTANTTNLNQAVSDNPPMVPVDEDTAKEFIQRVEYASDQAAYHEECARRWRATEQALRAGLDTLQGPQQISEVPYGA